MNYFITNREIIKKGSKETIREDGKENAGDNLRFGKYNIITRIFELFEEPTNDAELNYSNVNKNVKNDLKGSAKFFSQIYTELILDDTSKSDVLFFIHGFNTDLNGVRKAFERLNKYYVENEDSPIKHVIIFTWPGMHPLIPMHYFDDKKDAIRSGEALARGIDKIIRFLKEFLVNAGNKPCNKTINLMVHSMGHRVLKHMMLELKKNGASPLPELFGEIILLAADIEYDIFEPNEAFPNLIDLGKRVHVYFHQNDRVLDISKYTKNFSNRLGRYGRKRIDKAQIDVIDAEVTEVTEDIEVTLENRLLNHWYYYTSTEVINDIISVLNGKLSNYAVI